MTKDKEIYGIDISKSVFDVYSTASGHNQLNNDDKGFKLLLKALPQNAKNHVAIRHRKIGRAKTCGLLKR